MSLTYLSSPYSDPDPAVRQRRFEEVCKAAHYLMTKCGEEVFCPIAHSHSIEQAGGKIETPQFWMRQDIAILRHCTELCLYLSEGWETSKGMDEERELARSLKIPIFHLHPKDVEKHFNKKAAEVAA